jgi:phage tail tube protein FII
MKTSAEILSDYRNLMAATGELHIQIRKLQSRLDECYAREATLQQEYATTLAAEKEQVDRGTAAHV